MELVYPVETFSKEIKTPEPSGIQDYFAESTVFVTGATGFLGRLLVEKLLRTCTDLKRIYILMRAKKDKTAEKRFQEYFDNVIYDKLKQEYPKALEKLFVLTGDCGLPDLGLNEKDQQILTTEVNCIFHVAATVRFDEKLRTAAHINVRGTRDLMKLAKQVKNLSSIVYVSTAYSFCSEPRIGEEFYEPAISGEQLITLVDTFGDEKLSELTPTILGKWPNTYVFTKAIAEDVVKRHGADLPIAMVRPAIVIATSKEPLPGWIDNFYGATGVIAGAGVGLIRTLHCDPNNAADMVPADYVVNSFIAAAWDVANTKGYTINKEISNSEPKKKEGNIPVFNYVCSPQRHFTWGECMSKGFQYGHKIESVLQIWHHFLFLNSNKYLHLLMHYLMHILPAYLVDFCAYCLGKQPQLVKGYAKISKFLDVISFFASQQFNFSNLNTQGLWAKMSPRDKRLFEFDMGLLDWDAYFRTYIPGIRVYVVKDPAETIPRGATRAFRLKVIHYVLVGIFALGLLKLLLTLCQTMLS